MIIIHDKRIPGPYIKSLKEQVPECKFKSFPGIKGAVYESISCHPDVYLCRIDDDTLVHSPGLPEAFLEELTESGIELISGEKDPSGEYPQTARYNALRIGDILLHNLEHTDPVILEEADKRGIKTVHISQGYARCSVFAVERDAIITSDKGIAAAAESNGIKVLLISRGSVELPGEEYGFIGGASGMSSEGKVFLLGDPVLHPDHERMGQFLVSLRKNIATCSDRKIYDSGGLFVFG